VVRFMELGIRDADRVLMVCTANDVAKAEERKGGAGYEGMIVTGHVARATDTIKFVPIVRDHVGEPLVPGFLGQRLWLDFRDDGLFEERLEELLRELHGAPRYPKPALGRNPFAGSELEGAAKDQESPSPTPGPSRGSRETAGHRQEAGVQRGAKGPSASAGGGTKAQPPLLVGGLRLPFPLLRGTRLPSPQRPPRRSRRRLALLQSRLPQLPPTPHPWPCAPSR
jgi:hypothetical protein